MTPKQILDSFSETLMRDERILSARERALIASLLQHAKTAAGSENGHSSSDRRDRGAARLLSARRQHRRTNYREQFVAGGRDCWWNSVA